MASRADPEQMLRFTKTENLILFKDNEPTGEILKLKQRFRPLASLEVSMGEVCVHMRYKPKSHKLVYNDTRPYQVIENVK